MFFDRPLCFLWGAALVFFVLSLPAAPISAEERTGKSGEAKVLRVLAFDTAPFFYRADDGRPAGLEYELLRSFAESKSYRLQIVWTSQFADLLPRLAAGSGDLAVGALTSTKERRRKFYFSIPHFPALSLLIERRGEESSSVDDLAGKRFVVRQNSSNERILMEIDGVELVYAPTIEAMLDMVADGEVQGAATDSGPYLWRAENYPTLAATLRLSERTFYGFAMPADSEFRRPLNKHLKKVRDDGRYREFLHAAFGKWGAAAIDEMSDGLFEEE